MFILLTRQREIPRTISSNSLSVPFSVLSISGPYVKCCSRTSSHYSVGYLYSFLFFFPLLRLSYFRIAIFRFTDSFIWSSLVAVMYIVLIKCHGLFELSGRSWVERRSSTAPNLISDPSTFIPKYSPRPLFEAGLASPEQVKGKNLVPLRVVRKGTILNRSWFLSFIPCLKKKKVPCRGEKLKAHPRAAEPWGESSIRNFSWLPQFPQLVCAGCSECLIWCHSLHLLPSVLLLGSLIALP